MITSIIQLEHNDKETKQQRLENVTNIINKIDNTDLILLPELWGTGFFSYDLFNQNSEALNGETISNLSKLAKSKNAYIFTGSFIEKRDEQLYNTAVILDRNGEIISKYSKIHLFGDEKQYLTPGVDITVADTDLGRIGLSICYDLRFPELYRKMSKMGAEIFLSCYALNSLRAKHWQILTTARALENQAFFFSCGCTGMNRGIKYSGNSMAVSPHGEILGMASDTNEILNISFDINEVRNYRNEFPVLTHRKL